MHEINSAAEIITAAADPDANIMFGATINPEIDGEIIITVVATGFDSSYYGMRSKSGKTSAPTEKAIKDLDMDIDKKTEAEASEETDFISDKDDEPLVDMWSDEVADKDDDKKVDQVDEPTVDEEKPDEPSDEEPENDFKDVEKPSFLRRLKKRKENSDN
jgi:hypothetical protein